MIWKYRNSKISHHDGSLSLKQVNKIVINVFFYCHWRPQYLLARQKLKVHTAISNPMSMLQTVGDSVCVWAGAIECIQTCCWCVSSKCACMRSCLCVLCSVVWCARNSHSVCIYECVGVCLCAHCVPHVRCGFSVFRGRSTHTTPNVVHKNLGARRILTCILNA